MSPDSEPQSRHLVGTTTNTPSTSNAVMPSIAPLRIDSEEAVWWALVDAFGGPNDPSRRTIKKVTSCDDVLFPERGFNPAVDHPSNLKCIQFIDLISRVNNPNPTGSEYGIRLARLGQAILSESKGENYRKYADAIGDLLTQLDQIESSTTDTQRCVKALHYLRDYREKRKQAVRAFWGAVDPTNTPQREQINQIIPQLRDLLSLNGSEYLPRGVWEAAMIGILALRISYHGFGAQEEEATQMLGGSAEQFRASIERNGGKGPEGSRSLFGLTGVLANSTRFIGAAASLGFDISCLFDRVTTPELEQKLSEVPAETRTKIIKQFEARHARMMEGPAATGERRIISGTAVWASNFREHLSQKGFNHLDLSNLFLEGADVSGKQMAGCRFEGSNLRGTLFNDTNLRFTRFGTADLTGARFNKNSDLRGADLSEANLSGLGSQFFDQHNAKVFSPLADIDAPRYDSTTRFLPKSWDKPFHRPTPEEKEHQKKRFEGWTPEQVEFIARKVGVWQKAALKRLAGLLREDAKNNLILSSRNQSAIAQEFFPDILVGNISQKEIETTISRHQAYVDSAGLPLLKGNHENQDLTHHNLRGGFIVGASLINALMPERDLEGVCINNSNLSGINLRDANLTDAILVNVDLTGADLRGVNLTRTRFVNCNLDRVLLDGATMLATQMHQSTLSNVTISEGVIDDLLVSESVLKNLSFSGRLDGKGLFIGGIGLADSLMINAQFSGFTTVNQIELLGSLFVGSGPGILDEADIIVSPESEWRDQMIQVVSDPDLGDVTYELSADQDLQRPAMRKGGFRRHPTGQASLMSVIKEHISWGGERHSTVSRFDHLRDIGFQPHKLPATGSSENPAKLILLSGAQN